MSIENANADSAKPAIPTPKCPHCAADMPTVSWNTMGPVGIVPNEHPAIFVNFFCPTCKATLNCQLIPLGTLQIAQAQRPAVVLPREGFRPPGGRF